MAQETEPYEPNGYERVRDALLYAGDQAASEYRNGLVQQNLTWAEQALERQRLVLAVMRDSTLMLSLAETLLEYNEEEE